MGVVVVGPAAQRVGRMDAVTSKPAILQKCFIITVSAPDDVVDGKYGKLTTRKKQDTQVWLQRNEYPNFRLWPWPRSRARRGGSRNARGKYKGAIAAVVNAERRYRSAQNAVLLERSG